MNKEPVNERAPATVEPTAETLAMSKHRVGRW